MNPQNKPLPKRPPREHNARPFQREPDAVRAEEKDSTDRAAQRTPSEQEHADYGGEHFDLKTPKKKPRH